MASCWVLALVACLSCGVTICVVFPLFLATDLGLKAFGIAAIAAGLCSVGCSAVYFLQRSRRERYGLYLNANDISCTDVRAYLGSLTWLSYRSLIVETPYLISMILSIRMSAIHGSVFQFLHLQSTVADNIAGGLAMVMNFMGARLWGAGYYGAFWYLSISFLVQFGTLISAIFGVIGIARGSGSLADDFAKDDEKSDFDSVMTPGTFGVFILMIIVR